ncbi:alpha/beta-hydrolase [Trametes maxima]|nr:alpha/beta-hydrolase [Trametes maxima]
MPTTPVDDKGSVLYYEDSGVPTGSSDYITIVLVHGTCFHSAIYRTLIPYASARNLRLVLLNLRDYPGSTPYSEEDVEDIRGPSVEAQSRALQNRGLEIATFLRCFIETQSIPPINETASSEKLSGGLSLLSWSGGNTPTVAMFAHANQIPEEMRCLFDKYLRSFILYDPSSFVVGQPAPAGLSTLRRNPSAPAEVQVAEFAVSVSSYYPPIALPDVIDPPPTYDPPRRAMHESADEVDPKHTPTTSRMTPEVLRSVTHPVIFEQNQHLTWAINRDVCKANLLRALYDCRFDDGSGMMKAVWPALKVHVVWCNMTVGDCAWAAAVIRARYSGATPEHRRPLKFHKLGGANHFVSSDSDITSGKYHPVFSDHYLAVNLGPFGRDLISDPISSLFLSYPTQ